MKVIRLPLIGIFAAVTLLSCVLPGSGSKLLAGDQNNPVAASLSGKNCRIWDDPQGIPHVFADSDQLALACLGYVHARDRAWQMDFYRRTAQGRKAEVLGKTEIPSDFKMRLLKLYERAGQIFDGFNPEAQASLWAYTYGVNEGMKAALKKGVYEFQHWDYEPEPWQPADTIALMLLQSFDQTRRTFGVELDEQERIVEYGEKAGGLFAADGMSWDTSVLKSGEYPQKSRAAESTPANEAGSENEISALRKFFGPDLLGIGRGSNNWVVAPQRSATGHAWFANDPHLSLQYPPVWHWAHLEGGRFDVIGAALPGIPLIVSGTNRKVSWGLTNSYLDVADLVMVDRAEVRSGKSERPVIWFRFGKLKLPFFFKSFQYTPGGHPVLPVDAEKGKAIVLQWTGFDVNSENLAKSFESLFELMSSESAEGADRALSKVAISSWNFVYADVHGKIGYRAVGLIPRRETPPAYGIERAKLATWEFELRKRPMLSAEEMPHVFNPARGFVVTANNRQWPSDSQFFGGRAYQQGYRAYRIEELLLQTPRHELSSLKRTQCDVQAVDARFLLPKMLASLKAVDGSKRDTEAMKLLESWNFEADLSCRACAIYRRWVDRLEDSPSLNSPAIYRSLTNFDPKSKFAQNLEGSFNSAIQDLEVAVPGFPEWGKIHRNYFHHLSGQDIFKEQSLPTPGDDNSVNPGSSEWVADGNGHFDHDSGASQRLIVELSDPPVVHSILPGSNQDLASHDLEAPGSPWREWAQCELQRRNFPLKEQEVQPLRITLE